MHCQTCRSLFGVLPTISLGMQVLAYLNSKRAQKKREAALQKPRPVAGSRGMSFLATYAGEVPRPSIAARRRMRRSDADAPSKRSLLPAPATAEPVGPPALRTTRSKHGVRAALPATSPPEGMACEQRGGSRSVAFRLPEPALAHSSGRQVDSLAPTSLALPVCFGSTPVPGLLQSLPGDDHMP